MSCTKVVVIEPHRWVYPASGICSNPLPCHC
jgi:hypothetical protein